MDREITPQQAPAFRMYTCGNWAYMRFDSSGGYSFGAESSPLLLMVSRGRVAVTVDGLGGAEVNRGHMALIPAGCAFRLQASGRTGVLTCLFTPDAGCCPACRAKMLSGMAEEDGRITVAPYDDTLRVMIDMTELFLMTDIVQTCPKAFAEKGRWLFILLCRRFGIHLCPSPEEESLDEMLSIWKSANDTWGYCLGTALG